MQAFNLWTAFSLEGLGCNFQHINPIVDQRTCAEWNISPQWSLKAQLVFGTPTEQPHEKKFTPTESRITVHGMGSGIDK